MNGVASWTFSRTEAQGLTGLLAGVARQVGKKFACALGVLPTAGHAFVMKAACARGHPNFLQGLLQVDDDLAAVVKAQRHHAARALIVDVGVRFIVDAVTRRLYRLQNGLGQVQVFKLGHYNPIMFVLLLSQNRILGRRALAPRQHGLAAYGLSALLLLSLTGCGQKGPLFLPSGQAVPVTVVPAPNTAAPVPQAPAAGKAPASP